MDQGNKLAVLLGDFLLASACKNLSKIHNNEVVSMMSQVIADISPVLICFSLAGSDWGFCMTVLMTVRDPDSLILGCDKHNKMFEF